MTTTQETTGKYYRTKFPQVIRSQDQSTSYILQHTINDFVKVALIKNSTKKQKKKKKQN